MWLGQIRIQIARFLPPRTNHVLLRILKHPIIRTVEFNKNDVHVVFIDIKNQFSKPFPTPLPFFWSNKLIINAYLKGVLPILPEPKTLLFSFLNPSQFQAIFVEPSDPQRCLSSGVDTTPTQELPWKKLTSQVGNLVLWGKHRICVKPSTRRMHHHHHHRHHHNNHHNNHHQIKVSLYHWHSFKWTEGSVW